MRTPWVIRSGLVVAVIAGCTAEPASAPSGEGDVEIAMGTLACPTTRTVGSFTPRFACGKTIKVKPAAGSEWAASHIAAAASAWNSALQTAPVALPRFGLATAAETGDVTVTMHGTAATYCGFVVGNGVAMYGAASAQCTGANHSDLGTALTHELSHVLGFVVGGGEKLGIAPYSDQCTTQLPQDKTIINAFVCQHELEYIVRGYGHVPAALPPNVWTQHIVTGVGLGPLVVGDSANPYLLFAQSELGSAPRGGTAVPAISADPLKAQVLSSGWVRGIGAGSTTLSATVTAATLPSTYALGGLMAQSGSIVPVTVTAPPPLPLPDLSPVIPGQLTTLVGSTIPMSIHQHNLGNVTAAAGWQGRLLLSQDALPSADDIVLYQYVEARSIAAGTVASIYTDVTLPPSAGPGNYSLISQLDVASGVTELSETNNHLARPITLTSCTWPTGILNAVLGEYGSKTGIGDCTGRTGVLTNGTTATSGKARFNAACTTTQLTNNPSSTFTVRGCKVGTGAKLNIYRDAAKTQLEKVYSISVTYEPI